jgi:hypothetical protein
LTTTSHNKIKLIKPLTRYNIGVTHRTVTDRQASDIGG